MLAVRLHVCRPAPVILITKIFHIFLSLLSLSLWHDPLADLSVSFNDIFICAELRQSHWPPGMKFLRGNTHFVSNAKTSRPSVCNAAEVCLVHREIAGSFLPMLLSPVGKPGRGIDIHRRRVHLPHREVAEKFLPAAALQTEGRLHLAFSMIRTPIARSQGLSI